MSQVVLYADEEYFRGAGKFLRVCRRLQLFFLITRAREFRQDAKNSKLPQMFSDSGWCGAVCLAGIVLFRTFLFCFSNIDKVRHGI